MASTVTSITSDTIHGSIVFIIRQYNHPGEIGHVKPVDIWESHELIVDEDTFNYLLAAREDEAIWAKIKAEAEPLPEKKRNNQVHPIFSDVLNKL